jgi:cellobiose-specific phosphotransferase system component IIA/RNA polymerase subunit RPABC4/transcription elongation factor Spt4
LPSPSGDKLCPICDSPLQPGSKKCSFCGTDLSIFDIEVDSSKRTPEPPPPAPKVSLDSRVNEIFSRPVAAPEPAAVKPSPPPVREQPRIEPVPQPVMAPVVPPEPKKAPEPPKVPEPQKPAQPEPEDLFECPACKEHIPVSATVCPKCGVMFAEEGAEMFQCPACNTLVSMDAKSCPGCGAVFVESEEAEQSVSSGAPSTGRAAVQSELPKKDLEPPIEEVKIEKAISAKLKESELEEKKKGGWFKWGKKEEPKPEPKGKPESKVDQIPPPIASSPKKPAGESVRELRSPVKEMAQKQAAPAPVRPAPSPAPAAPRQAPTPAPAPSSQDKGEQLARMVAEWKPLFALASEKEIDPGESKQLIDEAIIAGRERQVDKAIELVRKSKAILTENVDAHLAQQIVKLNEEIRVARDFGGDISRPTTYIQEVTRARSSGDIEAAYVYAEKVKKELLPITGRYNGARTKISDLKKLIQDCETFIVDTKEARRIVAEATKSFELKDFDKVDVLVKSANDNLFKAIPIRMTEEMKTARERLIDAKSRNVNITPMLTVLKSTMGLLKAGDYAQAVKEMRDFNEMMKKIG